MNLGKTLTVLISADIEGVAGVVDWDETTLHKGDHEYFRSLMAQEVNAAVEGALEAGASVIIVRDAHGSARNLLPDKLHPEAQLIRDWKSTRLNSSHIPLSRMPSSA